VKYKLSLRCSFTFHHAGRQIGENVLLVFLNQFMNKDSAQKQKPYSRLNADFQNRQSATLD